MYKKKKCKCPLKKSLGQSCKNCSRYKMVFMLSSEYNWLKIQDGNKYYNPARYCFLRQNRRPVNKVMNEMIKRFSPSKIFCYSREVRLYDRMTNDFISLNGTEIYSNTHRVINVKKINETEKSWLFSYNGHISWYPKSNCSYFSDADELTVPTWLLKKKFPEKFDQKKTQP